jgi:hypothetical protein
LSGAKNDLTPILGLKGERLVTDFSQDVRDKIDAKCKMYMAPPHDIESAQ